MNCFIVISSFQTVVGQTCKLFWKNISSLDMLHNHTQIYLVFCSVYWTRSENGGPVKLKNKKCSTCEIRKGFWRKRSYFEFNLPVVHLVKSAWYLRQPPHPTLQSKRLASTSPEWKLMNTGNGKRFGLHSYSLLRTKSQLSQNEINLGISVVTFSKSGSWYGLFQNYLQFIPGEFS